MAKLVYVDDSLPGISRRRYGKGWGYFDPDGEKITDQEEIDRLNSLAVPPAYTDVWFCQTADGHIQATGYDEKGRKQYRYHDAFRAQREAEKYEQCVEFGRKLPLIRARVESDMAGGTVDRNGVMAAIVRLLDLGKLRIGNAAYAKTNKSFGATTLRKRHAAAPRSRIRLEYTAKSGKQRSLTINDGSLARMVRRCQDLPGQRLFQYIDENGDRRAVGSGDVNDYIREAMGGDFTAKHFRTWGASAIAFESLAKAGSRDITLTDLLAPVSDALGNTPAISPASPASIRLSLSCARKERPNISGGCVCRVRPNICRDTNAG